MVYIDIWKENVIFKKIQVFLILKNISYNAFKIFLGIFHSLISNYYNIYINTLKVTLCTNNFMELKNYGIIYFLKNLKKLCDEKIEDFIFKI
jgi:hypothetical protein